jgi:penicillin amidase
MKRILRSFVLLVVLAALALAASGYGLLRASLPSLEGHATLPMLSAAASVDRDALGIVTVQAETRLDAARALGYAHAQDRYFQMDLLRRSAAGELSGLVGAAALPLDRSRRLHRLRALAGQVLQQLPESDRALLSAYAEGANAGLGSLRAQPFEYYLLRSAPQPWTPADSLLVGYAMFIDLTDEDGEYERGLAEMQALLPPALLAFLNPPGTHWDAPLSGPALQGPSIPGPEVLDLRQQPYTTAQRRALPPHVEPRPEPALDSPVGSNAWAVDGHHSHNGAMVAGDMHLTLGVPHIWYRARLKVQAAALDITGVSLPGLPMLVSGSNGHIAWAFTNSYIDTTDLVALELNPQDSQQYRTPEGWKAFGQLQERIEVKGAAPQTLDIRMTQWGPVVPAANGGLHAIHWLGGEVAALNLGLQRLEAATSVDEAVAIAPEIGAPPQNLVVADAAGAIAWTLVGRIPLRRGFDGRLPASWADGAGWTGWLEPAQRPALLRPEQGRIWSANARMLEGQALALVGDGGYDLGARQQQIRDGLMAKDMLGMPDMLRIHLDDRAVLLGDWQGLLLQTLGPAVPSESPLRAEAREAVRHWQARAAADSVGYRIVRSWRRAVQQAALAPLFQPVKDADPEFRFNQYKQSEDALWALVTQQPNHLLNPIFHNWNELLAQTLDDTLAEIAGPGGVLAGHSWGQANTLAMKHPLSRAVPALGRFLDMPAEPLPGDNFMPRVQSPSFGASQRAAVSPGRESEGYFHMPGGQSGHPLSPYYRAGHEAWVHGEPTPFLPGNSLHHLQLQPAE